MSQIAFIFPGQGAQLIEMGKDFYDNFSASRQVFEKAEDLLKYNLVNIIFNGPKEKLGLTQNSQLAMFVNSMAILSAIQNVNPSFLPKMCAGLSLGEYSALAASKKAGFDDLIFLIQKRAKYMDEACKKNPGSMAAVLGLKYEEVDSIIKEIDELWIANINTPAQIVISGKKPSIEKAQGILKERGAKKVILLEVQGAFHCPLMQLAQDKLALDILNTDFFESSIDIIMNYAASAPKDIADLKENLIKQITSAVRWADCVKMMDNKVDLFIEIGCGKTLTNMNKSMGIEAKSLSVGKVADLKELEACF